MEDKIRKLLALASGGATEAEALAALQKATELADRYGIRLDEIGGVDADEPPPVEEMEVEEIFPPFEGTPAMWQLVLGSAASKAMGCVVGWKTARGTLFVSGSATRVAAARALWAFLVASENRCEDSALALVAAGMTGGEKRSFRAAFRVGFATAVSLRVAENQRALLAPPATNADQTALAIRNSAIARVEAATQTLEVYQRANGIKTAKRSAGRCTAKSDAGWHAGRAAGSKVDMGARRREIE
jgi:hypothetical protein